MIYGIIKDGICENTIVSSAGFADTIGAVEVPEGYGIGDRYIDGVWEKGEAPKSEPTTEDRISALESAMLAVLEG